MPGNLILPDFENVTAGGTARLSCPVGDFTYYQIQLVYTESGSNVSVANMKTAIEEITIEVDNREQWKLSGTELFIVNESKNLGAGAAGYLPLNLSIPNLVTQVPRGADIADALAWGTIDISSLVIKVKIASGRTAPALRAVAYGIPTAQPLGKILQYVQTTITTDAADTFKRIQSFEDQAQRPIVAAYLNSANVYEFEYAIGRDQKFDQARTADLDQRYNEALNLSAVSGVGILNFAYTGMPARDAQPLVVDGTPLINQTFSVKSSAAESIAAVIELLGERG